MQDVALLLLRVAFGGLMFMAHGYGKLEKLLSGADVQFPDPLGLGPGLSFALAALAESVCAGLVALGIFTRLNLVALMFTMFVAALVVHGGSPLAKKELGLLYLAGFTGVFLMGPGKYTLQRFIEQKIKVQNKVGAFLLR